MESSSFVLVDRMRAEQFALLGSMRRFLRDHEVWVDDHGIAWARKRVGTVGFAVTWLGTGWIFDPHARQHRAERFANCHRAMERADVGIHRQELAQVLGRLRLGSLAERLLWAIHRQVMAAGTSVVILPDLWLRAVVWGQAAPRHWRQDLLQVLEGLTWLHLFEWADGAPPTLGEGTALLTHVADLRGDRSADACDDHCPFLQGPPHHHYLTNIGRGFLGVLEQFSVDDGSGVRSYAFSVDGRKREGPTLRRVGKSGRLVSVYMPAKLGDPAACAAFTTRQHRLLQAVSREAARPARRPRRKVPDRPVLLENGTLVGNRIPDARGRTLLTCPLLAVDAEYAVFGGNGVRKGLGYYLATPGGWLTKAGYATDAVGAFLDDLATLARPLHLEVVGIHVATREFFGLDQLRELAVSRAGSRVLDRVHVRIFATTDHVQSWNEVFGLPTAGTAPSQPAADQLPALLAAMAQKRISRRALAAGVGKDPSFVAKVLNGTKAMPKGLLAAMLDWVESYTVARQPVATGIVLASTVTPGSSLLAIAREYAQRDWSVVPQLPRAKKPCVKWKAFQERRPADAELVEWFGRWPEAGLALILGPISGVFVVDVDGPEAHAALLDHLSEEPVAPKALSGSRKPCRYHLYFRCPGMATKAKATPWHPHLEFRGHGGIVIIPPSQHKSGQRYAWVAGRSPDDLPLPELPSAILQALAPPARVPVDPCQAPPEDLVASRMTRRFLAGEFSEGPKWNERLFKAACDLHASGMPKERALPLLLAGARPWNGSEADTATRTIDSAYGQPREPSEY
jgi:hypothetical protein